MPPEPDWPALDLDEREMWLGYLELYRTILVRKVAGLSADQLNTTLPPSNLTLGGLLKHMAAVEDNWFVYRMAGRDPIEPWASAPCAEPGPAAGPPGMPHHLQGDGSG